MSDVQTSFLVDVLSGRLGSGNLEPFNEVRIVPKRKSRSGKNEKFGKSMKDGCRMFIFQMSACCVLRELDCPGARTGVYMDFT
jgi:hypothetical protein